MTCMPSVSVLFFGWAGAIGVLAGWGRDLVSRGKPEAPAYVTGVGCYVASVVLSFFLLP